MASIEILQIDNTYDYSAYCNCEARPTTFTYHSRNSRLLRTRMIYPTSNNVRTSNLEFL